MPIPASIAIGVVKSGAVGGVVGGCGGRGFSTQFPSLHSPFCPHLVPFAWFE